MIFVHCNIFLRCTMKKPGISWENPGFIAGKDATPARGPALPIRIPV